MRPLWQIVSLQFRLALKNKTLLLLMFALPLAFTALFGLLIGGSESGPATTPVAIIDQDGSFAAKQLVVLLEAEPTLKLLPAQEVELGRLFIDRKIEMGAIIPAGFGAAIEAGRAPELIIAKAPGGNMQVAVQPILSRAGRVVAENLTLARELSAADVESAYAQVASERQRAQVGLNVTTESARAKDEDTHLETSALGMTVMFVMMALVTMGGVLLTERQNGTWARLLTAPASRAAVLGGFLLSLFLNGLFQVTFLVGASSLLFGIDWGPLPQLAALLVMLILCAAGLGLFVAAFVRTAEQQGAVGSGLVVVTCFIGGVFWPLDLMPKGMQLLGQLTPQAWAMEGLREVVLRGGAWGSLVGPLAALGGMTVLFLGIGLLRVKFE